MEQADTRQTRRRARTRGALLAAAEELFAARGPDAVSVDEIVAGADVAKGSFYNHFSDKNDLAREVMLGVRGEIERQVIEANRGIVDPAARVARALCVFARYALERPDRARSLLHLSRNATDPDAEVNEGVRHDVSAGLAAGRFGGESRDAAILLVMGAAQAAFQRALDADAATARKTVTGLVALLLRGLGVRLAEAQSIAAAAASDILTRKDRS
ncbi:MAG: TetR/AcrR family transcriptional regulator [Rhizomicrobium sp.]